MYSNDKISRVIPLTSTQPIQMTESNKKEPELVKLNVPFIGGPTIEFAKQDNLKALQVFKQVVSVESQVRIIEKLYHFHTSKIEFDESLGKYNTLNEKDFLATPFAAVIQYLKVIMALDDRFLRAYAKFGLMKNEALHKDVMEYLADKKIIETQFTSQNCGQELARLCDIVHPYLTESEKIVENRSRDVIGKYKVENDNLSNQLNEAKLDISELNSRIEQLESSKQQTEANLTIAEEKHEELTTRKSLTEEQIYMSQEKMAEYFTETKMEEGSELNNPGYKKLFEDHQQLEISYENILGELKVYQGEINNLNSQLLLSRAELEKLVLAKKNSTKEFENVREELRLSREAQEYSEINISKYKSEIVDLTSQLKQKEEINLQPVKTKQVENLISEVARLSEIEKRYNALLLEIENSKIEVNEAAII